MQVLEERFFFGFNVGVQFQPVEVRGGRKLEIRRQSEVAHGNETF
jgi:hypothetical protein